MIVVIQCQSDVSSILTTIYVIRSWLHTKERNQESFAFSFVKIDIKVSLTICYGTYSLFPLYGNSSSRNWFTIAIQDLTRDKNLISRMITRRYFYRNRSIISNITNWQSCQYLIQCISKVIRLYFCIYLVRRKIFIRKNNLSIKSLFQLFQNRGKRL